MLVISDKCLDPALEPIREKVRAAERLSHDDGLTLYGSRDIFTLGELANIVRERLHGRKAYYNINRHINYTNYCVLRCKFCSFYRPYPKGEQPIEGGYEFSVDEIAEMAAEACERGATEAHIVGGLHPKLPFSYYTDMCRAIRQRCPKMHIKAFTAIEIIHFTRISKPRMSIAEVLIALRESGLGSMPGGGAEIFDDRVHAEAFQAKVGEKHWFDVHRTAHDLGIPTNATMLYGHVETVAERITHLVKLREHQDLSLATIRARSDEATEPRSDGGRASHDRAKLNPEPRTLNPAAAFNCCIPLSFIPDGSELSSLPGPSGLDDLRTLAISRLMLDNVPHIKAFWIMQTPKLAQVALNWGVDDFDGTVVWYDITKVGGADTHQEVGVGDLRRTIIEAGYDPVERDTLYRRIERDGADWRVVQEGRDVVTA
ncbi:MAG: CofH family radical SAM protein [Planctomycetes bacterium]|nr:CofH family radical SAM protein [Planctomycetota bacterium]